MFFSHNQNKTPLYSFLPLCLFVCCRFRLSDLLQSISKTTDGMGWDGMDFAAFFFVRHTSRRHIRPFSCCAVLRLHGFMPGPAVPGSHTTNYYDGQSILEYQDSILCEWMRHGRNLVCGRTNGQRWSRIIIIIPC